MSKSDHFLTFKAIQAFDRLKQAFVTTPVLRHFDVKLPIQVETNASEHAIGRILCQQNKDGYWHPVAYYSRKMITAEQNYETYNTKLLAIVEVFKH